ncbi:MAG: bifunctional diguanylate cyclase/phosphodiesterase [Leptospiraceae bacterium]|nr:bifunctional diguanylate cyclase/phosphodiesterase [Leptospiraceae bacterium]
MRQGLERIFVYRFHPETDYLEIYLFYRTRFFQFVSTLFLFYLGGFFFVNWHAGRYYGMIFDAVAFVWIFAVQLYLYWKEKLDQAVFLMLPITFGIYIYFIYGMPAQEFGIVWIFALVLFLLYSLGEKNGQIITWVSFGLVLTLFIAGKTERVPAVYSDAAWFKIILVHLLLQLIGYLFMRRYQLVTRIFEHRYYTDSLTGLFNRLKLEEHLSQAGPGCSLILFNIKEFAAINNFYGKDLGDRILKQFARRLRELSDEYIWDRYRLSGDEFALLSKQGVSHTVAESVAFKIIHQIQATTFEGQNEHIRIRLYAGISAEAFNKIETADMALTQARSSNQTVIQYSSAFDRRPYYFDNLRLLNILNDSIQNKQIRAVFQPIHNNNSGKVDRAEALLRIQDQNGDLLNPGPYLPVARRAGLYPALTGKILASAARFIEFYQIPCSVNIAGMDLQSSSHLFETVQHHFGIKERKLLTFELVEDDALHDRKGTDDLIAFCKAEGCKIAIDDFGAGYSNFRRLMDLQIDYLKLDGSLIENLDQDPKSRIVIQGIMKMATEIGIEIIAEYVHSRAIATIIQEIQIPYSQGFFFGKAVLHDDFGGFLSAAPLDRA